MILPKGSIMHWQAPGGAVFIPSEHGRDDLDVDFEEIATSTRMANGRLRKQYVATKRSWSTSWTKIPAPDSATLDKQRGGAAIEQFYLNTPGEFQLTIRNSNSEYNGIFTVVFDSFDKTHVMRGKHDFWDISITLVEV